MKRTAWLGMALGLSMMALVGCGPTGKLTTGTVNTVALVQSDPDYQKMASDYAKARVELQKKINATIREAGGPSNLSQTDLNKFRQMNAELDKKWFSKTQEFLKARFAHISEAAEAVSKDKRIDLVLVDTPGYPTVEYGAVNITQDLELKLQQTPAKVTEKKK